MEIREDKSVRSNFDNEKINVGNSEKYMKDWLCSLTVLHRGHWNASRHYENINLRLGIATTISAAISGTTAFTQIQQQADHGTLNTWLQIRVGLFALIAAVLGAIQTYFRSSELSSRQKQAAQKFGKLRRELHQHLCIGLEENHEKLERQPTDFRKRWDTVDEESLPVPQGIYQKAKERYSIDDQT
jgi:hypothetical protein